MCVRTRGIAVGIALAATIALSGCSGGFFGDGAGQGGGGTSGNGQSGSSGDGPVIDDPTDLDDPTLPDDGGISETDSIPADFPAGIPLIDEPVSVGISMGSNWTLVFDVEDAEASYTEQSALLLGAGFTSQGDARSPEGSAGAYDSPDYGLQMTSSATPDPTVLIVVQSKN